MVPERKLSKQKKECFYYPKASVCCFSFCWPVEQQLRTFELNFCPGRKPNSGLPELNIWRAFLWKCVRVFASSSPLQPECVSALRVCCRSGTWWWLVSLKAHLTRFQSRSCFLWFPPSCSDVRTTSCSHCSVWRLQLHPGGWFCSDSTCISFHFSRSRGFKNTRCGNTER